MTNQEIFNKSVRHINRQGKPAVDDRDCRYRLDDGNKILMCGIGCLIPDKEYSNMIENCSVKQLIDEHNIPSIISKKRSIKLMTALQQAHDESAHKDSNFIVLYNEAVKEIAKQFRLKMPRIYK